MSFKEAFPFGSTPSGNASSFFKDVYNLRLPDLFSHCIHV